MPEETRNEEKTFTQEQLDNIVKERLAKVNKKYADYDELAAKAKAYDEAQTADTSEFDKAVKRAEEAEQKLAAYEQEKTHNELVKKVMSENNVDAKFASLLTAQDEDALIEQAKLLAERFAEPVPSDTGKQVNTVESQDGVSQFAQALFG